MARVVFVCLAVMAHVSAATFCASAQDGAGASSAAPLDVRPAKPRVAQISGPFQPPAEKAPAKPKPKAKPAAKPATHVAKAPEPQPPERTAQLATGSIKAPAGAEKAPEKTPVVEAPKPLPEARPPFDEYVVAQYCAALSSAASDGRLAWQAKRLDEMEGRLRDRIAELEAKRAETADWLKRREEALRKADEVVVAIYSKMKPDAAAAQFSAMDESGAAAILSKLNPRAAGIVLNEIDAARAARIAAEMAGVGPRRDVARSAP